MNANKMIFGLALAVCAGTALSGDEYQINSEQIKFIAFALEGEITTTKTSVFVKDVNANAAGVCVTNTAQDAAILTDPDDTTLQVSIKSQASDCSVEYGQASAYFSPDGVYSDGLFDGNFDLFFNTDVESASGSSAQPFVGASVVYSEFSVDYVPLDGEIKFSYCGVFPEKYKCNFDGTVNTDGRRVVTLFAVNHNGASVSDEHFDSHESTLAQSNYNYHTFPEGSAEDGVSYSVLGTTTVDTKIIVASFYDSALDLSGDYRFSQLDVDMIDALTTSDPELDTFDIDGDGDITDWDVDAFQWIIDLNLGSGLLGDGDGDEDIDCDDYDLAVSQPFAGEYRGDTSGDYRIQFDADLDGDNDADDIDAVFYNFRSFNPDWSEVYGTLDVFDLDTFIAAYNAMDPSADLAAPFGTFDIFDVYAYNTMYSAGACP